MAKSTNTAAAVDAGAQGDAKDFAFRGAGVPAPIDPLIRSAIERKRGGWKDATDEEVRRLWASLDEDQRADLLKP